MNDARSKLDTIADMLNVEGSDDDVAAAVKDLAKRADQSDRYKAALREIRAAGQRCESSCNPLLGMCGHSKSMGEEADEALDPLTPIVVDTEQGEPPARTHLPAPQGDEDERSA